MNALMIVMAGILGGAVLLLILLKLCVRIRVPPGVCRRTEREWEEVRDTRDPGRRVLGADAVFDGLLRSLFPGEDFVERMRRAERRLPNTEAVWRAHKVRNRIAHEAGAAMDEREAAQAVQAFEKAIRSLLRG